MADTSIEWTNALWARFVSNIGVSGPNECWLWKAGCFQSGYGQFRVGKKKVRAHRAYYERVVGQVEDGLILLHECDTPRCCNPEHLKQGTHLDNARDRVARGRSRVGKPCPRPGSANPAAKFGDEDVAAIKHLLRQGASVGAVSDVFLMSQSQVRNIKHGRSWKEQF